MDSTSRAHASKHCNQSRQKSNICACYGVCRHIKNGKTFTFALFKKLQLIVVKGGIHHVDKAAHKEACCSRLGRIYDSHCLRKAATQMKTLAWHLFFCPRMARWVPLKPLWKMTIAETFHPYTLQRRKFQITEVSNKCHITQSSC